MIKTNCKFCGSSNADVVLDVSNERDTYLDYLKIDYNGIDRRYLKCNECGLIYREIILEEEEKSLLYKHFRDFGLRDETKEEYFNRITMLPKEESENYEKIKFLEHFIDKSHGSVLDVGCGAGVFLYSFKQEFSNWEAYGVEPTKDFSEVAKKHQINISDEYLNETTFNKSFKLVTLNHVLEHLDDIHTMLCLLKKYMDNDSYLYIEVPSSKDIGFLSKCHDRFMCQHDFIFSIELLHDLLESNGFTITAIDEFISKRGRNNIRVMVKK